MPHPKNGYHTADGKRVPGCTTIVGRWKDSGGLIQWAFKCGREGIDINAAKTAAADAGTCCHQMIDDHLHGAAFDRTKWEPPVLDKADHAFLAFLEWAEQNSLKLVESETSLVSERHRFGGTFDAAMIGGKKTVLLDYKTSSGVYSDMLVQVAGGYALLWEEHRETALDGMEILRLSKPESPDDPVSFTHHHWSAEIFPIAKRQFLLMREAYDIDARLKKML